LKLCTNCRGTLADFVDVCPYCGVAQPVVPIAMGQPAQAIIPQSSNKALASLICGILFLCAPVSIAAIILGHLALSEIKRSAGRMAGHGMALAGLVMGYAGIAITILYFAAVAFTVRNTLRQDVPGNQTAAIATMRTYDEALKAYAAKCPSQGFPATLSALGPGSGDCTRANLIDAKLAAPRPAKLGYLFTYTPGAQGTERVTVFALVARPVQPGITGREYFFLDESGIIRQADSRIIGPNSDPVDGTDSENQDDKD